jgi:crossover junction endodeoxyribonuclease RuvC
MTNNSRGMFYIGLDPGKGGGIAILDQTGLVVDTTKMPETERDLYEWLRPRLTWFGNAEARAFAILERVSASPQMGVVSAFTFGKGYGTLLGLLTALDVPFEQVAPSRWQAMLQCQTGGDKNISKRKAQQLYPKVSVTHAIADALLLAEYARRFQLGLFVTPPSAKRGTHGEEGSTEKGKAEGAQSRETGEGQAAARKERQGRFGKETAGAAQPRAARHGARSVSRA